MDHKDNGLEALKALLFEFFAHSISHDRRKEIESIFAAWQQQDQSWKQSIEFLSSSDDQYVTMFCLTALENVINKKWMSLDWQDRRGIKDYLYQYSTQPGLSTFAVAKTVKLVVDTARYDWPHFSPDFFSNVMSLLRSDSTAQLGLVYLHTTSQELGCPRQDLSVARNAELQRLLLSQIPDVFSIISDLLTSRRADESMLLNVLNHLFTWVPADQIPQSLVSVIFRIALDTQSQDKALLALSTLNEMLYRHWTPPCWQQFLQFIVSFLQTASQNFDKRYLDKMCDLLRLVLTAHMSRGADSMNELLSTTLEWTERQETLHPGLTSCIQVWNQVLDHPCANKYGDRLVELAELIIRRIQWTRNNQLMVNEDDGDLEEGEEEENPWQRALRPCLEIVARVAELRPEQILNSVVSQWVELCTSVQSAGEPRLEPLLRDLATLTRAVGRLSPIWGEREGGDYVRAVTVHLLTLARLQYHSKSDAIKLQLMATHCEALAALKACCYWLSRTLQVVELSDCTQQILVIIVDLLSELKPRKLQHCAAHLLATLTHTVRLADTWENPLIRPMFDLPLTHLHKEDGYLVAGGLLSCLILPHVTAEGNQTCLDLASRFVERLTQPLSQQGAAYSAAHIDTLHLLVYLVRLYESEGSRQKKLICAIFQSSAERALLLYRASLDNPKMSQEILQFFQTLLECLQTQVGVAFVQGVIQTFLVSFSSERLQSALEAEDGGGLQQLLDILDLVVRTPALASAGLTPLTVGLSLQLAQPVLKDSASPVVQEAYFRLVYSIVEHKWQYLVKGCVDSDQRVEEFLGLLRAMGRALLLTDINLFRLNLTHFEKLNQRWRLYRTNIFKKELLGEFLTVLLTTLLNKSHALLADDIALCLCHLISADPDAFFSHYLPSFLGSMVNIDPMQQETLLRNFPKDMDLPSLTKNIFRLVNDLSCYQICNARA